MKGCKVYRLDSQGDGWYVVRYGDFYKNGVPLPRTWIPRDNIDIVEEK